ncbi:hypothetical protein WJX72_007844 [[Myrmecia] bisecta]|uniref:Uncharacterized protein n=1 Tax=[Myrmecia] bisecta TaxID=41462 RepID=A0AAW1Q0U4_9CHLO
MGLMMRNLTYKLPQIAPFHTRPCAAINDPSDAKKRCYQILLKPDYKDFSTAAGYPSADQLWDTLMERTDFIPERAVPGNFLLMSFVNWFVDDLFTTSHGTNGTLRDGTNIRFQLSQLYGNTTERGRSLRTLTGGKLKAQMLHGEEFPPPLSTVQANDPSFYMQGPDDALLTPTGPCDPTTFLAMGHPRFNVHPGHVFWNTLMLRQHNHVCDLVSQERPEYSDEQIFQVARTVLQHIVLKIGFQDFVSDTVSPFRNLGWIVYDPDVMRGMDFRINDDWTSYIELNHLYRWHQWIPERLDYRPPVPMSQALWNVPLVTGAPLKVAAEAMMASTIGHMGAHNVPYYLKGITMSTIEDGRYNGLQSFNAYRRYLSFPALTSFEQFNMDAETTRQMRELYGGDIEKVDMFVGLLLEQASEGRNTMLCDTNTVLLTCLAFTALVNHDAVKNAQLWTTDYLTVAGKQYVQAFSLPKTISALVGRPMNCAFMTTGQDCTWKHIFYLPDIMRWQNMYSYIGMDFVTKSFWADGQAWSDATFILWYTALALIGYLALQHHLLMFISRAYRRLDTAYQMIVSMHAAYALIYTLQVIPYTLIVVKATFGSDFMGVVVANYRWIFAFVSMQAVMMLTEGTVRGILKLNLLLVGHHLVWYCVLLVALVHHSILALKVGLWLQVFQAYEFGLYVALLAYRLSAPQRVFQALACAGLGIFGITRIAQTILLLAVYGGSYQRQAKQGDLATFWVTLILVLVVFFIQFYTVSIYYKLLRRGTTARSPGLKADHSGHSEMMPLKGGAASVISLQASAA